METLEKVYKFADKNLILDRINAAQRVVCAFSGGADSAVLLCFLASFAKEKLICAHVNHCIRGAESDSDEAFCRRACENLGISLKVKKTDIPALAKEQGIGLEECARIERYKFLSEIAGDGIIATAHNATDNAETLVFNMCRGSGIKGMSGIDPIRDNIVRPLLCLTSEEIRAFAKAEGIEYVVDSTNCDTAYTRNYIRHEIIPLLKKLNPKAEDAMLRLSASAREDSAYLEAEAQGHIEADNTMKYGVAATLPDPILSRAIGAMYKRAKGTASDLSGVNIADCLSLIKNGLGSVSLPSGYALYCHKDKIFVASKADAAKIPKTCVLKVPGETVFGEYRVVCSFDNCQNIENITNIYNLSIQLPLEFDTMYGNLFVRTRKSGDSVLMGACHKKLKKLMCDNGIPQSERDVLPLICSGDEIVAVPGIGVADSFRRGERKVYITVYKNTIG